MSVPFTQPAQGLAARVEARAAAAPDAPALVAGARRMAYGELNAAANRLAAGLIAAGIGPGDLVALELPADARFPVALLAVMKAGAGWLPLDPALPAARRLERLELARPALLLRAPDGPESGWTGLSLPLGEDALADLVSAAAGAALNLGRALDPATTAYVMFTSGSTGRPRGVRVTHGNLFDLFTPITPGLGLTAADTWSWSHSCSFGFSIWEIFGALLHGACLVAVPPALRVDPAAFCALLRAERVSVLSLTPSGLRLLLAGGMLPTLRDGPLRLVALSGEALRADDLAGWFGCFGTGGPRLVSSYAITETAGQLTLREFTPDDLDHARAARLGRPLAGRRLLLLDGQGHPVPTGATGELYVAGDCVAAGYVDDEQLTAARFPQLQSGEGPPLRCYRTGDLARRLPDGELEFAGRADAQLKHRGYRIEPAEIEAALRRHPAIRDAVVGMRGDAGGSQRLVAWLVPETQPAAASCEFWPSLGGYQVYDQLLYDLMGSERARVEAYRSALAAVAPGRVVLDMGTGRDALLARMAAAAGARRVYAVELLPDAAAEARALVERLGLGARISVLEGDAAALTLPEPVEVCTQGIIGNIGSADGIVPLWNAVLPLLAPGAVPVPERCTTLCAPVELPEAARAAPRFAPLAQRYVQALFEREGGEFDLRLCVRNLPPGSLLGRPAPFEDLDFRGPLATTGEGAAQFVIDRDGLLDGLLLWTVVGLAPGISVDYLAEQQAWLPVLLPFGEGGQPVRAGDRLSLRWRIACESDLRCPDYLLEAELEGAGRCVNLRHESRHRGTARGATALHRRLLEPGAAAPAPPAGEELRRWLAAGLPDYMLPASYSWLPALPLNTNGKLDRDALPEPGRTRLAAAATQAPRDPLEGDIAALWCQVLDIAAVGLDEDFFDLGGDSIAAVQLTTGLQRLVDDAVLLEALFDAPTVAGLAGWLRREHAAAVARCYPSAAAAGPPAVPGAA